MTPFAALLIAVGLGVFLFRRVRRPLVPESMYRVEFDDASIVVIYPKDERAVVRWEALTRVAIRTTDDGPWDMDVFWGFHEGRSDAPSAVVPGGATGERALMDELFRRLPGVRADQIIQAMGSTSNAHFVIWEAEAPASAPPTGAR